MLFSGFFKKNPAGKKFIQDITTLADSISNTVRAQEVADAQHKVLSSHELSLLKEQSKDYYISLENFLKLIDKDKLTISDIVKACKHAKEINSLNSSFVEVYAIPQEAGILLTPEKPEGFKGEKVTIITFRKAT